MAFFTMFIYNTDAISLELIMIVDGIMLILLSIAIVIDKPFTKEGLPKTPLLIPQEDAR